MSEAYPITPSIDTTAPSSFSISPQPHTSQHIYRQPIDHHMFAMSHTTSLSRNRSTRHSELRSESTMSEDPEIPRPPRPESPDPPEDNAPPPEEEVTWLRLGAHYGGLVLASMLGCLIRLGLNGLGTYDGAVIYPLAWSQGVGSGIMGLSLARKNEIISIYPPIYTFLTTGIAGSVTTFSSWMLEGYLSFSNFDKYNRKGLHDTVDGVVYSLSTFAIAIASLRFGEHFSTLLPSLTLLRRVYHTPRQDRIPSKLPNGNQRGESSSNSSDQNDNPNQPNHNSDHEKVKQNSNLNNNKSLIRLSQTPILDLIWISTAFLSYLIILLLYFLGPTNWKHNIIFPMLLSPPGTIIRFYLSKLNTKSIFLNKFPLGTFLANIFSTIIISITFSQQRKFNSINSSSLICNGLYSIQQGFCGCLSTVSTFVVEARTIKGKFKWIYLGSSIVLGHLIVLAIVGGTGWGSGGYQNVCTG
ncbi:uncharacterized protein I206_101994 [Kwoniella pini CBS 10737]|uniref:Uncharacterized protein n=1 Tax=Kwoniella pini CBS 10737 TaxID=1296096 RepID=A0A1B9HV49_9TREE|nr:uncharacterized protein I206_06914 [Kwoniella pini CBS 10737]OCF47136.1 hypothetical protein I206_06914 [Kwoniella pini CBS 10737]